MDLSYEGQIKKRARAHTNIALIKYWGKKDEILKLPYNSSLSMTLDGLYTDTGSCFYDGDNDVFYLNGKQAGEKETSRVSGFIDLFRRLTGESKKVFISSYNNFPTAAGLASSASGYAALAVAMNDLFQTNLKDKDLSIITRKGSGSACRSLFSDFVIWHQGSNDFDSYAESFASAEDYGMVIIVVNKAAKKHSSSQGMKSVVDTSIFYPAWVTQANKDFAEMRNAILAKDYTKIGSLAECNCLKMHATTWGAKLPFTYFEPETLVAMNQVRELRRQGLEVYFTIDAGPNVKVFCRKKDLEKLKQELAKSYYPEQLITTVAGSGYEIKECENFGRD